MDANEFGCTVQQTNTSARLLYFKETTTSATAHGLDWGVWDDNGWYKVLDRKTKQWDAQVLAAMGLGEGAATNASAAAVGVGDGADAPARGAAGAPRRAQETLTLLTRTRVRVGSPS